MKKTSNGMKKYELRTLPDLKHLESLSLYPDFLRTMLYHRGIDTNEKANVFLNPSYNDHLHDPFGIAGMDKAVERILRAIEHNEAIVIYSDYDHDGIPGGVVLHDFFKKIGYQQFKNYIPHRYLEGYGLNSRAVETLAGEGAKVIITVDCGITDVEPAEVAKTKGVDLIITDHHLPGAVLPDAFVILNSKQQHDDYSFDMLCGAAVAFKLVQALCQRGAFGLKEGWEKWLLDLVGISTIADMVPLHGENRVFAHFGLKVLRKTPRAGLAQLFRASRINQRMLSEDDVGFTIAPRINAASRMDDPRLAFELLSTGDEVRAGTLAKELDRLNSARKGVVGSMVREMKSTLQKRGSLAPVIVLGNPEWRPGLLGLAANNLMEAHSRPVFLWGREGGVSLKGSCRSDGSVDVTVLMGQVAPGILEHFGGHALSGGFSVSPDAVHRLEDALVLAYERARTTEVAETILVDKKITPEEVTSELFAALSLLSPFGIGNPKPLFLFEHALVEGSKRFGKNQEHLEVSLSRNGTRPLKAIEFFSERPLEEFVPGSFHSFVATVEKSFFGRYPELRLRIIDVV